PKCVRPQRNNPTNPMIIDAPLRKSSYEVLFTRHESNPILSAVDWPYPVHTVFNPAATRLADGSTLLLCRVEDRRGLSHLCAARSKNGFGGWGVRPCPPPGGG